MWIAECGKCTATLTCVNTPWRPGWVIILYCGYVSLFFKKHTSVGWGKKMGNCSSHLNILWPERVAAPVLHAAGFTVPWITEHNRRTQICLRDTGADTVTAYTVSQYILFEQRELSVKYNSQSLCTAGIQYDAQARTQCKSVCTNTSTLQHSTMCSHTIWLSVQREVIYLYHSVISGWAGNCQMAACT